MSDINIQSLESLRNTFKAQRGVNPNMEIGDFTYGTPTLLWTCDCKLYIGKFCSIAEKVTVFLGGNHRNDWITTYPFSALSATFNYLQGHPRSSGDVVIGNDVWIARNVTIMSGVKIGNGVTIAANSHVVKDVPDYAIVGGNPATVIRYKFDENVIRRLLEIRWWDWKIEYLSEVIPILQSENIYPLFEYYEIHKESIFE